MSRFPVALACLALAGLVLVSCGNEPVPPPVDVRVYHFDPTGLGTMLAAKRPEALAFLPDSDQQKALDADPAQLASLSPILAKSYVVRLIVKSDHTWLLTLREQAPSGVWAVTDASGSWQEAPGGLELVVATQQGAMGLVSPVRVTRTDRGYELPARGRAFPLAEFNP